MEAAFTISIAVLRLVDHARQLLDRIDVLRKKPRLDAVGPRSASVHGESVRSCRATTSQPQPKYKALASFGEEWSANKSLKLMAATLW